MKFIQSKRENRDEEAWLNNEDFNRVYDKLWLSKVQEVEAAPWPIEPSSYSVVYKPIVNLSSGDCSIRKVDSSSEDVRLPGHLWMEYLEGRHYTVDGFWLGSSFMEEDCVSLEAEKEEMKFVSWSPCSYDGDLIEFLREPLGEYVGPLNVEVIGDTVIEIHLRKSKQIDKCRKYDKYHVSVVYKSSDSRYEIDRERLEENCVGDPVFVSKLDKDGPVKNHQSNEEGRAGYVLGSTKPEAERNKEVLEAAIKRA